MAPFNGVPSHNEQVALALAPKFTAFLSILSSSYIIYDCLVVNNRTRLGQTTYHRLMAGLSLCDLLMSSGLFTSTWPMPANTPNVWGAVGTVQSCEAIGFLEQAGVAAVMYNGSLSVYYLLRIRFGWSPRRLIKVEPCLHLVPLIFGLSTMIASLKLNLYNSGLFDCWIAPFPQGCHESWKNGGATTCQRGDNASLYQWIFDVIPKWSSVLLVTGNMWYTHCGVLLQERASSQYVFPGSDNQQPRPRPRVARRLARQSYLYVGALYLTYIPVIVTRTTELITGHVYYGMLLTLAFALPLQGFWNVTVYLRPRFLRQRLLLQAMRRQRRTQEESSSSSLTMNHRNVITPVFDVLRAASEAVREGCLSNEEGEDEEEEDPLDTPNSARSGPKDFTMVSNRDVSIVEECTAQEESGANA